MASVGQSGGIRKGFVTNIVSFLCCDAVFDSVVVTGNMFSTWSNCVLEVIGRETRGKVEPTNFG